MRTEAMSEGNSNARYRLSRAEYETEWHPVLRQVFRVPEDPAAQSDWAQLPDPPFREGFEIAFLNQSLFDFERGFSRLADFVVRTGEDKFAFVNGPDLSFTYAFPADVGWSDLDEKTELPITASTFYYYLVGSSGRWGFYHSELYSLHIVGYKGRDILEALQAAFGFEGRNSEAIVSLKNGSLPPLPEGRLWQMLLLRFEAEEPDTRAYWDPEHFRIFDKIRWRFRNRKRGGLGDALEWAQQLPFPAFWKSELDELGDEQPE